MSESRPGSGMASGAVLRPSARVDEGQSRTRRVRDQERGREGTERTKDRDTGSILVHQQNNPCSVQSVQKTTENYREVPSNTELYRKHKKDLAY